MSEGDIMPFLQGGQARSRGAGKIENGNILLINQRLERMEREMNQRLQRLEKGAQARDNGGGKRGIDAVEKSVRMVQDGFLAISHTVDTIHKDLEKVKFTFSGTETKNKRLEHSIQEIKVQENEFLKLYGDLEKTVAQLSAEMQELRDYSSQPMDERE